MAGGSIAKYEKELFGSVELNFTDNRFIKKLQIYPMLKGQIFAVIKAHPTSGVVVCKWAISPDGVFKKAMDLEIIFNRIVIQE